MNFPKFLKIAVSGIKHKEKGSGSVGGMTPNPLDETITETIASALGFSYEMSVPSDGKFGTQLPGNNWTGMLGMLQRHEADMVVSFLVVTEEREKSFLFSYPTHIGQVTFATRKHESFPNMSVFLHPFSSQVWYSVAVCICVMPLVFKFLLNRSYSLQVLLLYAILSVVGQSTNIQPTKSEEHVVLSLWYLGSAFVSYTYSAVLLSFITFPTLHGISTISDLARAILEGKYQSVSYPGSYVPPVLIGSNSSVLETIGHNTLRHAGSMDFVLTLENYTSPKMPAFLTMKEWFQPYKDFYFISKDSFFISPSALAMRKNFCCRSQLNKVIHRLWVSGIMVKIYDDSFYKTFLKDLWRLRRGKEEDIFKGKLTVSVFMGPFIFLIFCHLMAIFVFFVELYLGRNKKRKKAKLRLKRNKNTK